MLLGEILSVALGALRVNKLRSFLTMLGIVIGVAAVIAMVALGSGAQQAVEERIASLGTRLLTVSPGQAMGMGGVRTTDQQRMTMKDALAIEERGQHITAVQAEMQRQLQVQYLNRNANTSIIGTTANYLEVRNSKLAAGRMFTAGDDEGRRRVAVAGPFVVEALGIERPEALIGQHVRIRGLQFEVIGILETKGQSMGWFNPDDQILIPLNTARFRVFGTDRLRSINVLAASDQPAEMDNAMVEIQRIMRREHRLRAGRPDDFSIRNQSDILNTLGESTEVFSRLLLGIAIVSLLVGGIGIMNIMLVSVTERTREIGVRKALGATRMNVLLQFLIEAVVLSLLGGLIGIALGVGTATYLDWQFQWNTAVQSSSIALSFFFAALIGVMFGVWPARRAARLDPIEALRYE
ncbi:MAG: ABC transporter permease [Gemmatimonadota bacterium]|nr:ABC transporter permease [Gemmatimonadota bacterium]